MAGNAKMLGGLVTEALLAGFWFGIGFDPFVRISELSIMGTAKATNYSASHQAFIAPSGYVTAVHLFVALTTVLSVVVAWTKGGTIGLAAMGCAFLGGALAFGAFEFGSALIVMAYPLAITADILHSGASSPSF